MPVRDTDKGYRAMIRRMSVAQRGAIVSVGIHAEEGSEPKEDSDDVTLVNVAEWNEFGTDTIPARSFVRGYVDSQESEINAAIRRTQELVLRGRVPAAKGLALLGTVLEGGMKKRIADGIPPANAPSTIEAKGSSKPLIDTGQLRAGITSRVRLGGAR